MKNFQKTKQKQNPNQNSVIDERMNVVQGVTQQQANELLQSQFIQILNQLRLPYQNASKEQIKQIKFILTQILEYPSTQLAQLHYEANRLGTLDLSQHENDVQKFKQTITQARNCPCCGFVQQKDRLALCTDVYQIKNMGVSTFLYFMTIKVLVILLALLFLIYSIYSLNTNVESSAAYTEFLGTEAKIQITLPLYISISLKFLQKTQQDIQYYYIQCWLGFVVVVVWGVFFLFVKRRQIIASCQIDKNAATASDFTILIKNYPKDMPPEQFQRQLKEYYAQKIKNIKQPEKNKELVIVKINKVVPFYLQRSFFHDPRIKQIKDKIQNYKHMFAGFIEERIKFEQFQTSEQKRGKVITDYLNSVQQLNDVYQQVTKQIMLKKQKPKAFAPVPAFVTFSSNEITQLLASWSNQSKSYFNICISEEEKQQKFFYFKNQANQAVQKADIKKAPEPEDIIWGNFGQPARKKFKKKFATYTITFLVLCLSFGVIAGISQGSIQYQKQNKNGKTLLQAFISFLISLCIPIFNIIIQLILRKLAQLDRNQIRTDYQVSLGLKAVFASVINSIIVPILVNYALEGRNLYRRQGLAEDIFYLGITNSLLSPVLNVINISQHVRKIKKCYYTLSQSKLYLNQTQLNKKLECQQFQIGYQYIYIVNVFLFTCFYVSLQPIIVLFSIIGLLIMYWAQKYSLFNTYKRPTPGNSYLNFIMYQLIYIGPLAYSIGSFCWSHFLNQHKLVNLIPNLLATLLSFFFFLIPYKHVAKKIFTFQQQPQRLYERDRIFMPSQYDRLNPATSQSAIKQYIQYLHHIQQQFKGTQKNQKARVQRQLKTKLIHYQNQNMRPKSHQMQMRKRTQVFSNGKDLNPLILDVFLKQKFGEQKLHNYQTNKQSQMTIDNLKLTEYQSIRVQPKVKQDKINKQKQSNTIIDKSDKNKIQQKEQPTNEYPKNRKKLTKIIPKQSQQKQQPNQNNKLESNIDNQNENSKLDLLSNPNIKNSGNMC